MRRLALPALEAQGVDGEPVGGTRLLRLGLAVFLTLNVMVASWLAYSTEMLGVRPETDAEAALLQLAAYLALALTTAVVALLGLPLAVDAARALFAERRLDAQLLIVVSVFAAYLLSAFHTVTGSGSLYFDTAAVVLVIVTLGAHLEAGARARAATEATRLLVAMPQWVQAFRGDQWRTLEVRDIVVGELVAIAPGARVAIDGEVVEGASRVDDASLTGEARRRAVGPGHRVLAGGQNHEGRLIVRVDTEPTATVLAQMERALVAARQSRPPVQRAADRVAAVFVPAVALLALGLVLVHAAVGDLATGLLRSLGVLLIACPCALGLAAPLATWHGLRRAAERGVLVDSAATLERAGEVARVFLDKTGTLTLPEPVLDGLATTTGVDREWALLAAASLEASCEHPIARAVVIRAAELGVAPEEVTDARQVAGRGVEATFHGERLRLGSARWVTELGLAGSPATDPETTVDEVVLMSDRVLARFALAESAREDAAEAVAQLHELGLEPAILSGDGAEATGRLASQLGLAGEGNLLPDDKVRRLEGVRSGSGLPVAMIGDGINDAAVLAAADVGIAVGSASDLASRSGHVRLVTDRLTAIPALFRIARDVRRRIRLNLTLAFGFNTIGIALATVGWLTPVFAALAMVLSSLAVIRISSGAGAVGRSADGRPPAGERALTAPAETGEAWV